MGYIELDRSFVEVKKNVEPDLGIGPVWGRRVSGWMSWDDLLKAPRAVLLAEAASGKTAEFQFRVQKLQNEGKHAFFLAIEELAEKSITDSLGPPDATAFHQWKVTEEPASFFLDSLDEARLKLKSLESALKSFAHSIGQERLDRIHVYISCRVSDWRGELDRSAIKRWIPYHKVSDLQATPQDDDTRLLAPIFEKKEKVHRKLGEEKKDLSASEEVSVVQLVPLSTDQMRALASHFDVLNVEVFLTAIQRHGLEVFAQRPGDLVMLINYWRTNRNFAPLSEMTEYGIRHALKERDLHRADSGALTHERTRIGAERLAAALTLSKSWTIQTIDPASGDPTLASGALDPRSILLDWSDEQIAALLRRSIFAPASYGCVRFHHRSSQEFLTASWLVKIRGNGAPISTILKILFADAYGSTTAVPTLRPVAGWLALWIEEVRNQLADCEPFVLLVNGDPRSLPVEIRSDLLALLAKKHAAGEVSDDRVDSRALWMFADPRLASALRAAWEINDRADFRQSLLRMIREGAIVGCADLASNVVLDRDQPDYLRGIALEAMESCNDDEGMKRLARRLLVGASKESPRFTAATVEALFPRYLTVSNVLQIMTACRPARPDSFEGFSSRLNVLWESCPTSAREEFAEGIGRLCLSEPYVDTYHPIAKAHVDIARSVGGIIRSYLECVGDGPTNGLVQLLRIAERVDQLSGGRVLDSHDDLATLVHQHQATNRALFWSDVSEAIDAATLRGQAPPPTFWAIWLPNPSLWRLDEPDLRWLYRDIQDRPIAEQRIALSAIMTILHRTDTLESEAEALQKRLAGNTVLLKDLESTLAETRKKPLIDKNLEARQLSRAKAERQQMERDKASWIDFKQQIIEAPDRLRDSIELSNWSGVLRLVNLTTWLEHRTGKHLVEAVLDWRFLEEGFSKDVAVAYREGMCLLWRIFEPVAPIHTSGNGVTIDRRTQHAFAGLALESSEIPSWASKLDRETARRAARLSCIAEEGFPVWMDALIGAWPDVTLPTLTEQLDREWKSSHPGGNAFLYWYAHRGVPNAITGALFGILTGSLPATQSAANLGIRLLQQMALNLAQRQLLLRNARVRIKNLKAANWQAIALELARMIVADPAKGLAFLLSWLHKGGKKVAVPILGSLFSRRNPLVFRQLTGLPVPLLVKLIDNSYTYVSPKNDVVWEGVRTPDIRDEAEGARERTVQALRDKSGPEAYAAMLDLSVRSGIQPVAHYYFRELAKGMLERDVDLLPWSATDLLQFERNFVLAAKSGPELMRRTLSILDDIAFDLKKGDYSARKILQPATTEEPVQEWLAAEINTRGRGALHMHRETEVANGTKPDFVVASAAAPIQVAIELKHGNKWTLRQLEYALLSQLAEDYLKPAYRRQGILVISLHKSRMWRHPANGKLLTLDELIEYLKMKAANKFSNKVGEIAVAVCGLDAATPAISHHERKNRMKKLSSRIVRKR